MRELYQFLRSVPQNGCCRVDRTAKQQSWDLNPESSRTHASAMTPVYAKCFTWPGVHPARGRSAIPAVGYESKQGPPCQACGVSCCVEGPGHIRTKCFTLRTFWYTVNLTDL